MSKKEFSTPQSQAQANSWEERLVALRDAMAAEFRRHPLKNMFCMTVFSLILLGGLMYGLSYIAPNFDPSR